MAAGPQQLLCTSQLAFPLDPVTAGSSRRGLDGSEGTFLLCTFWLAEALAVIGGVARASAVIDRAVAYANDLGLLAEQVDPTTGELLGSA